jgi:hypothetical protein
MAYTTLLFSYRMFYPGSLPNLESVSLKTNPPTPVDAELENMLFDYKARYIKSRELRTKEEMNILPLSY